MNEKVKEYLERVEEFEGRIKAKDEKALHLKRQKLAMDCGIFDKEYNESTKSNKEYDNYDFKLEKYYKKIPIDLSEEDLIAVENAYNKEQALRADVAKSNQVPEQKSSNLVATALKVLAWLDYIGCFIAGVIIILASQDWLNFIIGLAAGFISGTMLLGFSEIIRLLHEINEKTAKE